MRDTQGAGRTAESELGRVLRGTQYFALNFHHSQPCPAEGDEAVDRWRPGAQRWRAEHESMLQFLFGVIEQSLHQAGTAAEATKDCSLAHTGAAGDGVHRHRIDASLGHEEGGGIEQEGAITCGVAARRWSSADLGEWNCAHGIRLQPGE